MSPRVPGTASEHDSHDSPAFGRNHNNDHQGFGASRSYPNGYAVPSYQPIVDQHNPLLSQVVAQANGYLPLAQSELDAGPRYPCQINSWDTALFHAYHPGVFNSDTAFHGAASDFPYHGIETQPTFPTAPMVPTATLWNFNGIQDFDESNMSIPVGVQLIPASSLAMVSAPAAPAPAPAAADGLRCPHGCPATFGRGGEYRRHMMIHERPRYRCPMVDCPKTFSRADKLRDHAKRGHGGRNPLKL